MQWQVGLRQLLYLVCLNLLQINIQHDLVSIKTFYITNLTFADLTRALDRCMQPRWMVRLFCLGGGGGNYTKYFLILRPRYDHEPNEDILFSGENIQLKMELSRHGRNYL